MKYYYLIALVLCTATTSREIRWNWDQIDINSIYFPKHFLWGWSESALQTEGIETAHNQCVSNSWTEYEEDINMPERVGVACQRWSRYKDDFTLAQSIGMQACRFSIDWSKIEPQEGEFDNDVLDHYNDMIDTLLEKNIVPMITLFHHVAPLWFMKKSGFEYEENNYCFMRFALHVFKRFHDKVPFWIIFNEPVAYAFEGYFRGKYPPGKQSLSLAGTVILNQLNTHVKTATEFKKINPNVKIGIAHMCHPIDAYSSWNLFEKSITKLFSFLMNETVIQFFKTGKFYWTYPWPLGKNDLAPQSLDFFGVNYYTHTTIRQTSPFHMEACVRPDEIVVDRSESDERSKVMYPEGLYRSIVRASKLQLPLYITENGVATENPLLKEEYIKKHLYVISRALREGYDIRGYCFWTLVDCYSWNKGYNNKHGIFAVDFATQERTFRPSTQYLIDTMQKFSTQEEGDLYQANYY